MNLGTRIAVDAYLAGFFDGEGSVIVYWKGERGTPHIRVNAAQVVRAPLDLLKRTYGGTVRLKKTRKKHPSWQPCYVWETSGASAHWALSRMLPWLIVKRKKASAAIAILQNTPPSGHRPIAQQRRVVNRALHAFPKVARKWIPAC